MMKVLSVFVVLVMVATGLFAGDVTFSAADANVAFTISNSGSEAGTFTITSGGAGAGMTIVFGTTTNTIDGSGAIDTVAELKTAIEAVTNTSGEAPLRVDVQMSLNADSTDGELIDAAISLPANGSGSATWDTSVAKFYSVYVAKGDLALIYGDPLGTGSLTLNIYKNGSLIYNQVASTNDNEVVEEDFSSIVLPTSQKVLVRAIRATTATTGNLGVVTE